MRPFPLAFLRRAAAPRGGLALRGALLCGGLVLGALPLGGCRFQAEDLEGWKGVVGGADRLAGYYADPQRPQALRAVAARALFDLDRLDQIFGVVRPTAPADRGPLLTDLSALALERLLDPQAEVAARARAAHLGYAVLEFRDQLPEAQRGPLVDALLGWALPLFGTETGPVPKAPGEVILGAAAADLARARAALAGWFVGPVSDRDALAMVELTRKLRDPELDAAVATALLTKARAEHPALSVQRVDVLLANGNPTLSRYLLASVADLRVPFAARAAAINAASERLKAEGLDLYLELLGTDDPANGNQVRLMALDLVWLHAGVEKLAEALRALPPQGTWPEEGDAMQAQVRDFCDASLARNKVAARPVLVSLLEDPSWVARAYALECIQRLYPQEAAELLAPAAEDPTPLRGWGETGETTVGAVVQALQAGPTE